MSPLLHAAIDPHALRNNLRCARAAAPGQRILAVIKSDGYGHGLRRVARALEEADAFAVGSVEEALTLRESGCRHAIVALLGFHDAAALRHCVEARLWPVVHAPVQIELLERMERALHGRPPIDVWLKVDTGMGRLGLRPEEAAAAHRRLTASPMVGAIGLMTHLAHGDDRQRPETAAQIDRFNSAVAGLPGARSIANSGGLLGFPATRADWARPGIMLYGASPFSDDVGAAHGLRPAMTLRSRLIAVKRLQRGEAVGYGGLWRCPEAMPVGVAAIGYGGGYPRHAPAGTPVLVNGRRAALIGRVSMEMIAIDLRALADAGVEVAPGDPVTLWGEGLPAEEVARSAGTIAYDLFCGVSGRARFEEKS